MMRRPSSSASLWLETCAAALLSGVLLVFMVQPALHSFFLAEDFVYIKQYRDHGNSVFWAAMSPMATIFFRPVLTAVNIFWMSILPFDPFIHHLRNISLTLVAVVLLHRVLMYFAASWYARAIAIVLFVASKIHLTTIGYITNYEATLTLILMLATILCFLRYIEHRRILDYCLGLLFCMVSMGTKDYGFVVSGIVIALVGIRGIKWHEWRPDIVWWAWRLAPLPLMVLGYFSLRYAIVGPPPSSNSPIYSFQLSLDVILAKLLLLITTIPNLVVTTSLGKSNTGGNGLGHWLPLLVPGASAEFGDTVLFAIFALLVIWTLVATVRRVGWLVFFPLVWIGGYFGPTLVLTRNIQMYYMYESLAAIAVLVALCLSQAGRPLRWAWGLAVIMIVANGTVSNQTAQYNWQFAAERSQRIEGPVLNAYAGKPLESITFITGDPGFWGWTLTVGGLGPMIPEILGMPDLRVRVIDYRSLSRVNLEPNERNLVFDIDNDFVAFNPADQALPLLLREISAEQVAAGTRFNVQPSGRSAIAAVAGNARPGTVIMLGETQLRTSFGSAGYLTAEVPDELLARPGRYEVYLSDGVRESNRIEFNVVAKAQD